MIIKQNIISTNFDIFLTFKEHQQNFIDFSIPGYDVRKIFESYQEKLL